MQKMGAGEGRLEATDGLGEIPAVQIPEALDEFHQPGRHGEHQRELTQVIGRQYRPRRGI